MARKKNSTSDFEKDLQETYSSLREENKFAKIKFKLKCKNQKQKEYSKLIKEKDIVFCTGPAGAGKSYVALGTALELLKDPNNSYKKMIILVSPLQTDIEIG